MLAISPAPCRAIMPRPSIPRPANSSRRDALATLYGGIPKGPAISYCNTGHTAALNWFVMSELLGREEVALYDGSMTDWTQDPERPVATGAG